MKREWIESILGLFVLIIVLAVTGNIMWGLMAQCITWIILSILLKRDKDTIAIYASALLIVVAIWRAPL